MNTESQTSVSLGASSQANAATVASISIATASNAPVQVYWHRELPPLDAQPLGEYVIEANSFRLPAIALQQEKMWARFSKSLMDAMHDKLQREIQDCGGNCAHMLYETVESRQDAATGETWLHGRFTYRLYYAPGLSHEVAGSV